VSFDSSGKLVVSGGADASLRIWDVSTAKEVRRWNKHAEAVVAVVFLDGANYTLSASRDGEVKVWKVPATPYVAPPGQTQTPMSTGPDQPITLQPSTVLRVGGTLTSLQLSPDGRFCYCLDLTSGKIVRMDVQTGKQTHEAVAREGTEVLSLSPDGERLAALVPSVDGKESCVQVFDATLKLLNSHDLPIVGYDLVSSDRHLYVSGGTGDWTDIAVVDPDSGKVLARWGGVWRRSLLRLSPDQKRLYVSSQDVAPGTLDVFAIPESVKDRPAVTRTPSPGRQPLGGPFVVSPDGRYVLCTSGTVLRDDGDGALRFHHALEPFISVAFLPEKQLALVLSREGTLDVYRYPDFAPVASHPLGIIGSGMACSGKESKLILTGIDPATLADRPRARGMADVFVVELGSVTNQAR
jgi:WD40 repeat protein